MSQESVEIVRQPIKVTARPRRRPEERLLVRFPRVLVLLSRALDRLPLHSRLRRALVHRSTRMFFEAGNRNDYEMAFALYHPRCESSFPPELPTVGSDPGTHGREERILFQRKWISEWGEFRFEPAEIS